MVGVWQSLSPGQFVPVGVTAGSGRPRKRPAADPRVPRKEWAGAALQACCPDPRRWNAFSGQVSPLPPDQSIRVQGFRPRRRLPGQGLQGAGRRARGHELRRPAPCRTVRRGRW